MTEKHTGNIAILTSSHKILKGSPQKELSSIKHE